MTSTHNRGYQPELLSYHIRDEKRNQIIGEWKTVVPWWWVNQFYIDLGNPNQYYSQAQIG